MEDYTYLRDPQMHGDPFDPMKYIPLALMAPTI